MPCPTLGDVWDNFEDNDDNDIPPQLDIDDVKVTSESVDWWGKVGPTLISPLDATRGDVRALGGDNDDQPSLSDEGERLVQR